MNARKLLPLSVWIIISIGCQSEKSSLVDTDDSDVRVGDSGSDDDERGTESDHDSTPVFDSSLETDSGIVALNARSCKRGVAYGHHSPADLAALSPGVRWWYNWYFYPDTELGDSWRESSLEFVPMWWGDKISFDDVKNGITDNGGAILGFNEPNFYSQANMSASEAAALWPQLERLADDRGLALGSPAVNFCGGGCHGDGPVAYLNAFFEACSDCRVDFIAVHIYVACDGDSSGLSENRAQWLINHLEMYKREFDQPIWLTEFACSGNPTISEQKAFLEDAVAWLENEPQVERYAWFSGRADNMTNVDLLDGDGELTVLGEAYITAPFSGSCP